jgi:hypothetical protein
MLRAPIRLVRPARPFADDALKVACARHVEERTAARRDVIEVQQSRFNARHDGAQTALSFEQRQPAQQDEPRLSVRHRCSLTRFLQWVSASTRYGVPKR